LKPRVQKRRTEERQREKSWEQKKPAELRTRTTVEKTIAVDNKIAE
jgi:hypothetical protein